MIVVFGGVKLRCVLAVSRLISYIPFDFELRASTVTTLTTLEEDFIML